MLVSPSQCLVNPVADDVVENTVNTFSFWQLNDYFLSSVISRFKVTAILNVCWVNVYINFLKQFQNSAFKNAAIINAGNAWFPPWVMFIFMTFTFQSFCLFCQIICSVFTNLQFRFQNFNDFIWPTSSFRDCKT